MDKLAFGRQRLNDVSECVISIELRKFRVVVKGGRRKAEWVDLRVAESCRKAREDVLQSAAGAMRRFHSRQAVPVVPQIVESCRKAREGLITIRYESRSAASLNSAVGCRRHAE